MIISVNTVKAFNIIQHCFMIKSFNKVEIFRNILNLVKGIYRKPTVNTLMLRAKYFPPDIRNKIKMSLSLLVLTILIEVLAREIKKKEIKGMQITKVEVNLSLFNGDMILYRKNSKLWTRCYEMILTKLLNTKQTFKNKLYFYTLAMNILKMN